MSLRVLDFADGFTSASVPSSIDISGLYDIIVSSGSETFKTHSTFASGLAAAGNGDRILVLTGETLNATHTLSLNNVQIDFYPDVTYTKGTALIGLIVSGNRNKINGARFLDFSAAGDVAISVTGAYNRINDCSFNNCNTEINDAGLSTSIVGSISE